VAMCGPIVAGIAAPLHKRPRPFAEVAVHHLGRLWTYATLGLLAGILGEGLRAFLPGQRVVAGLLGGFVVLGGLSMMQTRGGFLDRWIGPRVTERLSRWLGWQALRRTPGLLPRLLAGALMGLMPCGMVWTMLLPAAAMPHPLYAALAMVAFGLGTLPALTSVVLTARYGSKVLQRRGRTALAALMIVAGVWMMTRAVVLSPPSSTTQPNLSMASSVSHCQMMDR